MCAQEPYRVCQDCNGSGIAYQGLSPIHCRTCNGMGLILVTKTMDDGGFNDPQAAE